MKALFSLCLLTICMLFSCTPTPTSETDYTQYVNPFIGTDFTGNTYPGAQVPFGMVQLSPDNGLPGWDRIAGYFYPDSTIAGFSHTHLSGTGAGDLYDISFLPVTLPHRQAPEPLGIHSRFSHAEESATAGYYRVHLADYDIRVELTATERCGIQRYTFPQAEATAVYLDLRKAMNWDATTDSYIEAIDSVTIQGYRYSHGWARGQKVYFRTRFSRPFEQMEIDSTAITTEGRRTGTGMVARFYFGSTEAGTELLVSTALSGVSMEGAARNLQAEAPQDDFEASLRRTKEAWNSQLSRIAVEGEHEDDKVNFYTALYRTMLAPTLYCDVDGAYYGPDRHVHHAAGWQNYSTFSLWDTYRAAHPLYTYTAPERVGDMVQSLLAFYDQNGRLPVWNFYASETDMMIGYHAVPVIVDAYLKGIGGFDARRALEACVATARMDSYRGIGLYRQLGYVPYNVADEYNAENWSLSKTLEYAYDDWCIARMAEQMKETEIAQEFYQRAQNYRNLYNPDTGFMQPRDDRGRFISHFRPEEYTPHICESNAWQYFWSVQHDVEGLIGLAGGKERFAQKLDSMFTHTPTEQEELPIFSTGMIGQYVHGNEPSHHVIYLYNAVGQPHRTQAYVAQVMNQLYRNTPDGLCGNEDCGQMSAWYVFSAMGFYPVNPVGGRYELGTPLFPRLQLQLPGGKTCTVLAHGLSKKNIYVSAVCIDGKPYHENHIGHEHIMSGATIEFYMTDTPPAAATQPNK